MSTADNPDWTSAFSGNVNFTAYQDVLVGAGTYTIGAGSTLIPLTVPIGVLGLVVYVKPTANGSVDTWNRCRFRSALGALGWGPPQYMEICSPEVSVYQVFPVTLDTLASSSSNLEVHNFGASFQAELVVLGYGAPASQIRPEYSWQPITAWQGWEATNINDNFPGVTINRPNVIWSIDAEMMLLGISLDASAAVTNNAEQQFFEVLAAGGYYRSSNGAPYTIGANAVNPTGPTAPGFAATVADSNVGYGPPTQFEGALYAEILKSSSFSGQGDAVNQHIEISCEVHLVPGDGLWFHMGGAANLSGATLDFEQQPIVRYALL